MRSLILIVTLVFAENAIGADKLTEAIEKGLVTREFLNTLTDDDVPKKWRTTVKDESDDRSVKRAFMRGGRRVLQVTWSRDWTGAKANQFTASIYDGQQKLCRILKFVDGTLNVIVRPKEAQGYDVTTSLKEDGGVSVTVVGEDGYLETIEVRGRDTRLMDDLEYTKMSVSMELIATPLKEAIDEINTKPAKRKR